jgi:hypothetical protein
MGKIMGLKFAILAMTAVAGAAALVADTPRSVFAQVSFGQRCQTSRGICVMTAPAPVGSQCVCPTPVGPLNGFVIQ